MKKTILAFIVASLAVITGLPPLIDTPPEAGARCNNTTQVTASTVYAREDAQFASTCNGNDFYSGKISDTRTDGSCSGSAQGLVDVRV